MKYWRLLPIAAVVILVAAILIPGQITSAAPGCTVDYNILNDWGSGATVNVTVANTGTTAINGWALTWTFPGNQQITNLWNGSYSQSGASASVSDAGYNANIPANNGSTSFGFNMNYSGTNAVPTDFALNGVTCNGGTAPTSVPPTSVPPTDTPPTSVPPTSVPPTGVPPTSVPPTSAPGTCAVAYTQNSWGTGFTADVKITNNNSSAISGWTLTWAYANGQQVTSSWNATVSQSGANVTASNPASHWNGTIGANGGSVSFGIQGTHTGTNNAPTSFTLNGVACNGGTVTPPPTTTTTPPPTTPPPTTTVSPTVIPPTPGTHLDNPFVGAVIYRNVDYVASVNAAADQNPALASRMRQVANYPTFVWMDTIAAVNGDGYYSRSLIGHMEQAVAQGANAIQIVVYNLPNRDCSALASNGELLIAEDGFNRYKNEYINPIANAVAQFPNLRVIAVIEPDSLPNLHTNMSFAKCQEADGPGGYRDGIVYALNTLGAYSNFYSYVDIGHHGWLGWQDSNFLPATQLIADAIKMADKGVNSIDGFVSNTANTSALVEPYHTANQMIGGQPARSASFHDWNTYIDELSYAQAWRNRMVELGFPSNIGMLIDTSRNGWGGLNRPAGPSTSTDLNIFVDESRIDRRIHKGNWCNQSGAGIGERPTANPASGIDAYVWVKPPGESDGSSELIPVGPENPDGKGFDRMCDPTYTGNELNGYSMTGALPNAPVSGRWFQEQFEELVTNAFPAFQ
ncbi:MAG: glycoside hydrolase family 6 protein [Anaerolineae bacterium]|nr:glycoside hydrolase family 6 protein [Anaerolineae bacterium]